MSKSNDRRHPMMQYLAPLIGRWTTAATHPMLPDIVIPGESSFEWLAGEHFLIWHSHMDHPEIPDSISIVGFDNADNPETVGISSEPGAIHYFDSRGVFRRSRFEAEPGVFRFWREHPGFSQRATCRFSDAGNSFVATGELCRDDVNWEPDVEVTGKRLG